MKLKRHPNLHALRSVKQFSYYIKQTASLCLFSVIEVLLLRVSQSAICKMRNGILFTVSNK